MGNSNITSPKLQINIQTSKVFYNSGSVIEGVVFINAMDNFQFDALYIRIEGDEFCQWFQGSSKNRRKYTGNQNFYAIQHMLCRYSNSTLQEGKYAYPFSIQLSENIPGTFYSPQYDAHIEYKLIAYFANFEEQKNRQHYGIPLIIRQPFRQEVCEYEGNITKNPVTCCFCNQGEIYLRVRFGKNVAFEKEKIKLEIQADNTQGTTQIKDFVIELVQYTFVSANSGICRTYRSVIDKKSAGKSVQSRQKILPFEYEFTVPEIQHQTAISTLVANYYRLEVSANVGSISKEEPSIFSPLFIMKTTYTDPMKEKHLEDRINADEYKYGAKKQIFKAPQYWFRKNKNLAVMNFRLQDELGPGSQVDNMLMGN